MNANAADESGSDYIDAYAEYELLEGTIGEFEDELTELEETLEGLEQDQIWDDAAAAFDFYNYAFLQYEVAVERENQADLNIDATWNELEAAEAYKDAADLALQTVVTNQDYTDA